MNEHFTLSDIPFETLPPESIRMLCEVAVRHMGSAASSKDMSNLPFTPVRGMDYRIPATMRACQSYGYGQGNGAWRGLEDNKEAVLTLLNAVMQEKQSQPRTHVSLSTKDISPSVFTNPDVLSFVLDNASSLGCDRGGQNGVIESSVWSAVKVEQWLSLFETHPALVGKAFASRPELIGRLFSHVFRGSTSAPIAMNIAKTVIGFMHIYDNDSPAMLHRFWVEKDTSNHYKDEDTYSELFMHMCVVCRKDSVNMKRIADDLESQSVGGKKTRRRDAGWMTIYLNTKWDQGDKEFVIRCCRLVPPLFNLLYSTAKVSGEMRTLKRMYQLSGDTV